MKESIINVHHVVFESGRPFDEVVTALEARIHLLPTTALSDAVASSSNGEQFAARTDALAGISGFMTFMAIDHGRWFKFFGELRSRLYILGNPLLAKEMLKHNPGVGLYAPLRLAVCQNAAGRVEISYDLPSSLFGQFNDKAIDEVARRLDQKLHDLAIAVVGPS